MSAVLDDEPVEQSLAPSRACADTLAASVVIMLVMTVVQRLIGFGRGIMFCHWLDPEEIGQWDVAFGFLNLAAPLVVLGLPGSFGRYVEYFRSRGQFQVFLRRTAIVTLLASIVAMSVMIVERNWFSRLIFGSDEEAPVVAWLAICLAVVVGHNFLVALFIAVRRYRVVTILQFLQSLGFAAISLGLLAVWPLGATMVVIGYAAATLLSAVAAIGWLRHLTGGEVASAEPVPHVTFWTKLVPFATWMWLTNLLANLFEVIDRYMIVHHSGMDGHQALRQVGIYHSSRLVPLLFVAVAGLLGSMVTPHLSHDWEAGRRDAVARRLNTMLKLLLLSLFAASLAVLFVAPLLFEVAFPSKFHGGLAILPWTLAYCVWFGTIAVAQNYLWCAERAALGSLALLVGLLLSIGLNLFLLPRFGLEGAVWATSAANLATLLLTYQFSRSSGMHIDPGTWILSLIPVFLGLGPWISLVVLIAVSMTAATGERVFSREEKRQLLDSAAHALRKLRRAGRKSAATHAPLMTR
jgi:PST family polysaccharide transporter